MKENLLHLYSLYQHMDRRITTKKLLFLFLLISTVFVANAQVRKIDSLKKALSTTGADTNRVRILLDLSRLTFISKPDTTLIIAQEGYDLATKFNLDSYKAQFLNNMANAYGTIGDYAKAMQFYFKSLAVYQAGNNITGILQAYNNIGATYLQKQDYKKALPYLIKAKTEMDAYGAKHNVTHHDKTLSDIILINIGECYLFTNKIDSAEFYLKKCYEFNRIINYPDIVDNIQRDLGEVEAGKNNFPGALKYFRDAVVSSKNVDDIEMLSITYLSMANLYHKFKEPDSAEYYAYKALTTAKSGDFNQDALNASKALSSFYDEANDLPNAYKYFKIATAAKDSLYNQDKVKELLSIDFDEKQRQQDIAAAEVKYRDNVRMYVLIGGLVVLLFIVVIIWRNSAHRKRANALLQEQKEELEATLTKLEQTQDQLIQSEKMASLGELTAGIAHEIQNPLNFVNNFSEVSIEMIDEMKLELKTGNSDEAISIAEDIQQNLEKINHHGKRADGIVKGMLQHSRASSSTKEPTDINKLADEYLRLAYHGLRAKDKSFNADMVTEFNKKLPLVEVVPQDIGRVLLNLFTNAFYAVQQKQKAEPAGYKPTIEVSTYFSTEHDGRWVIIKVRDNGCGIPEHIRDKIMQPFFTTKPTGEGTGLGLSMSYDIVVKGHGGKIDVLSKYEEHTEFIISIPA